jgi:flagellar biosynthesis GTPase FlhF
MAIEILTGKDVPSLLARAQQLIGEDAVVVSVRRLTDGRRTTFEMVAADPVTAEAQRRREPRNARGAEVLMERDRLRAAAIAPRPAPVPREGAAEAGPGFWDLARTPRAESPAPSETSREKGRFHWPFAQAGRAADRPQLVREGGASDRRRAQVIALVGPTGAGKTTTMAKLANHPQAFGGRRVGLLGLDTYRIGGVEQARQYAELSRLPFEVVWDSKDIARALRTLKDCDVILVDTPGRGPRAAGDLQEAQVRLLELHPDEVHLVIPAGLQRSLARNILTSHLPFGVTHLLPSKLDEYPDERCVFEIATQFSLPMRWIADGQEVPRDLQLAPDNGQSPRRYPHVAEAV